MPANVAVHEPGAGVVSFKADDEVAAGGEHGNVPAGGVGGCQRCICGGVGAGSLGEDVKVVALIPVPLAFIQGERGEGKEGYLPCK